MISAIEAYVNFQQNDWDDHLPAATLCINTACQSSTKYTPFELVHGRAAVLPHQSAFFWPPSPPMTPREFFRRVHRWRTEARKLILTSQFFSKQRHDKHHRTPQLFHRVDLVLVSRNIGETGRTKKLLPKFIGPFQIVKQKCQNTYLVEDLPFMRKRRSWRRFNAHVAQIRPFRVREEVDWCPEKETAGEISEDDNWDSEADVDEDEEKG